MKTLCLDFDGVLHSYTSGWKGAIHIPDPPVEGALEFLQAAAEVFDEIAIYSSRSHQFGGIEAMRAWLIHHITDEEYDALLPAWFDKITWPTEKPPAHVTLDDRAILFTGVFPPVEFLYNFKPWNKK